MKQALFAVVLIFGSIQQAAEIPVAEWEIIKQKLVEVDRLKEQVESLRAKGAEPAALSTVDAAMDSKYGPNATPTTKTGKLAVGGLIQIWYYTIQRDNRGFFSDPNGNGIADNNLANDNNSFRIRRAELKLSMDINECISSSLMIEVAREVGGFPAFPSNQGLFKKTGTANGGLSTSSTVAGQIGNVAGGPPRILQDPYINFHNIIPYHDIQIGQFKQWVGEEGTRSTAELDFVERSILGLCADNRDLGAVIHGSWWGKDTNDRDGRFQYWAGIFNAAGSFYNPGNEQNRSDNNQSKDFNGRILVRPLWGDCVGKLEIGASYIGGTHGAQNIDVSGYPAVTAATPIPPQNYAYKANVWAIYKFGNGFVKGLWLNGEWGAIRDKQEGSVIAFGNGNLGVGGAKGLTQTALQPFTSQGGFAAAGYRFGDASWVECMPCWLKSFEIAGRYEQFQNIETTNLGNPNRTSVFNTKIGTAGLNYFFSGGTKIQANYNIVELPTGKSNGARNFHDTQNNNFVINFQVAF